MRELHIKISVSILILVIILALAWILNDRADRIHPEREIQMQQLDIDIVETHPDWQNDMTEHFMRPFGPREYIRIYPRQS